MTPGSKQAAVEPVAARRPDGDGAVEPKRLHQPRASLCRTLAILWSFPSVGAAFILGAGESKWRQADGLADALRAVRFEQWIALGILAAHAAFIWLAWRLRRTEPWREIASDPDVHRGLH